MRTFMIAVGLSLMATACTMPGASATSPFNGWIPVGMAPQDFGEDFWACSPGGGPVTVTLTSYNDPDFIGSDVAVRIYEDLPPGGPNTAGSDLLIGSELPAVGSSVSSPALAAGACFLVAFQVPGECVALNPPGAIPACARFSTPGITYRIQW